MSSAALNRLKRLRLWQVGLLLLALYLVVFFALWQGLRLIAVLSPALAITAASVALAWAFVTIRHLREDDWI